MADSRQWSRQRVTIRDVAEAAGVSVSTVSNALNGRTTAMTEETRERIQKAIATLKFHRSSLARSLVTRRTTTIGLLIAEIETPLFLQAMHYIEPRARSSNYNLLVSVASNPEEEIQALDLLSEKQADGLIFFSTSEHVDETHLVDLYDGDTPVVLVNRASRHPCFDQINWDNTRGVSLAVEHLIRLGHRRIALMTGPSNRMSTTERIAGYRQGLAAFGLPDNPDYTVQGDYTSAKSQWEEGARRILAMSPRPTAAIASDDAVAAYTMRTLQRAGVRVPEDIAVIGIDDQPFASYLNPTLTTVRLPIPEAGEMAVTMLIERLAGRQDEGRHVMVPCELIVRESCGASLGPRSFA